MAVSTRKSAARKRAPSVRPARKMVVLVATRKGAFLFRGDEARRAWRSTGRTSSGTSSIIWCSIRATGGTLLAAASTGHLGPTIFRSTDLGKTWKEATKPPAFAKAARGREAAAP